MNQYIRDFNYNDIHTISIDDGNDFLERIDENEQYFSIFHCNIRNENKNFDEMNLLLDEFIRKNFYFDLIIFSET